MDRNTAQRRRFKENRNKNGTYNQNQKDIFKYFTTHNKKKISLALTEHTDIYIE